jgi:uncharacterized protein
VERVTVVNQKKEKAMPQLPMEVCESWNDRTGPVVLATVDKGGVPNIIYASSVAAFSDAQLVVADNYFDKTRKNLLAGSRGAILFITKAGKAYQVKGPLEYHTEGPIFDHMKTWNPPKHPGNAAVVLNVEAVYSGAKRLV